MSHIMTGIDGISLAAGEGKQARALEPRRGHGQAKPLMMVELRIASRHHAHGVRLCIQQTQSAFLMMEM